MTPFSGKGGVQEDFWEQWNFQKKKIYKWQTTVGAQLEKYGFSQINRCISCSSFGLHHSAKLVTGLSVPTERRWWTPTCLLKIDRQALPDDVDFQSLSIQLRYYRHRNLQHSESLLHISLSRCGSRTGGPNGDARKRWTPVQWSCTIPPCFPSIGPQCLPAWGRWPTRCPSIPGSPRRFPARHPCIPSQGSWAHLKACSRPTQATASSTRPRAWSRVCNPWAHHPTSVHPASVTNTRWRMTGVPASQHSGWRPKSTFSQWIKPGNTCDPLLVWAASGNVYRLFTWWRRVMKTRRWHWGRTFFKVRFSLCSV